MKKAGAKQCTSAFSPLEGDHTHGRRLASPAETLRSLQREKKVLFHPLVPRYGFLLFIFLLLITEPLN